MIIIQVLIAMILWIDCITSHTIAVDFGQHKYTKTPCDKPCKQGSCGYLACSQPVDCPGGND